MHSCLFWQRVLQQQSIVPGSVPHHAACEPAAPAPCCLDGGRKPLSVGECGAQWLRLSHVLSYWYKVQVECLLSMRAADTWHGLISQDAFQALDACSCWGIQM